ncbi:MAG: DUF1294 domain-containing protein [Phycisphaerae bacterium]
MTRPEQRRSPHVRYFTAAVCLIAAAGLALRFAAGWAWGWAYVASVNFVTFLFYAADKRAARNGSGRIPERQLLLLGMIGGSPAAILARHLLRHKTIKQPFRAIFWAICILQVAAVGGWLWWNR